MTIPSHELDERIVELLYGDLSPEEAEALREEISRDARLAEMLESALELQSIFHELPDEMPDANTSERIMAAAESAVSEDSSGLFDWIKSILMTPALAAVFLVVAGGGLFLKMTEEITDSAPVEVALKTEPGAADPGSKQREVELNAVGKQTAPQGSAAATVPQKKEAFVMAEEPALGRPSAVGDAKVSADSMQSGRSLSMEAPTAGTLGSRKSRSSQKGNSQASVRKPSTQPRPEKEVARVKPRRQRAEVRRQAKSRRVVPESTVMPGDLQGDSAAADSVKAESRSTRKLARRRLSPGAQTPNAALSLRKTVPQPAKRIGPAPSTEGADKTHFLLQSADQLDISAGSGRVDGAYVDQETTDESPVLARERPSPVAAASLGPAAQAGQNRASIERLKLKLRSDAGRRSPGPIYLEIAERYEEMGNTVQAIEYYQKALAQGGQHAEKARSALKRLERTNRPQLRPNGSSP